MSAWPPASVPEVNVDDLERGHAEGVPLIDVRQPQEYDAGHIAGARLIPLSEVALRVGEVPTGGPVYVICHLGDRSEKAVQFYRAKGIDAYSVAGGTQAWEHSGRPMVMGPAPG
jgi:rhodanese-related sulfurtransferase